MSWIPGLAVLLAAFWLLLSGHYTPLLIALGGLSVALVVWIMVRAHIFDRTIFTWHFSRRIPRYCLWLSGKILRSSLAVSRLVWSPRVELRPAEGDTPAELPELSQVIYANSITLTPGTLSLSVGEADIAVHSLESSDLAELRAGDMLSRVQRLEDR